MKTLRLRHEVYAVLVFAGAKDEIVQSGAVRGAIAEVARGKPIVAVGTGFTREAYDVLRASEAEILVLGEFDWTDASYQRARQGT